MKRKTGLLPRVVAAIAAGILGGLFLPDWTVRIALTFNALFGEFLAFVIPLLILGLVAPGIADLGRGAGRLLALTAALAYGFTLFSGFGSYFAGRALFPVLLEGASASGERGAEARYPAEGSLPDGVFGFTRGTGSDAVTVIANLTAAEQEVGLPTEGPLREFFTGQILSAGSRAVLPAWGWLVLTPEKE